MQYSIHITNARGATPRKFAVTAIAATLSGTWHETRKTLLRPDDAAIRAALPKRWHKAASDWNGRFWFAANGKFDGKCHHGTMPYATLHDSRGKWLCTLQAIPFDTHVTT